MLVDIKADLRTDIAKAAERIRELTAAVSSHTESASKQINALVAKYGKTEIETELELDGAALAKTYTAMKSVVKEASGKTVDVLKV